MTSLYFLNLAISSVMTAPTIAGVPVGVTAMDRAGENDASRPLDGKERKPCSLFARHEAGGTGVAAGSPAGKCVATTQPGTLNCSELGHGRCEADTTVAVGVITSAKASTRRRLEGVKLVGVMTSAKASSSEWTVERVLAVGDFPCGVPCETTGFHTAECHRFSSLKSARDGKGKEDLLLSTGLGAANAAMTGRGALLRVTTSCLRS